MQLAKALLLYLAIGNSKPAYFLERKHKNIVGPYCVPVVICKIYLVTIMSLAESRLFVNSIFLSKDREEKFVVAE